MFGGTPPKTVREKALYSFDLNVTDPEGDGFSVSLSESPSWLSLRNLGNGMFRLSGIPPVDTKSRGDANVTVSAVDSSDSNLSGFLGKVKGGNQVFQGDGSGKVFSIDEVVQRRPTNTCFLGQSGEVFRAFAKDTFKVRSKGIHVL